MQSQAAGQAGRAPQTRRLIRAGIFTSLALGGATIAFAWALLLPETIDDSYHVLAALAFITIAATAATFLLRQIILDLAAREQEAARLAGHDLLSGVANRFLFSQWVDYELARHRREKSQFALMYVDLDRFKEINDTHGHDIGDRTITAIAQRLSATIRPTDRLGRIGGDEFAIVQTGIKNMRDAEALALRIVEAMSQPFIMDGIEIQSGTSIGIALCPENSTERDELMKLADLALYRAKREGRGRMAFFDTRFGEELAKAHLLETDLAQAVEKDQFILDYQPVIDTQTRHISAIDTRLRWNHPTRGLIEAPEFLDHFGERRLAQPAAEWMIRHACKDACAWENRRIAITLSTQHFKHRDLAYQMMRIVGESGLEPERLDIQIKEDALIGEPAIAIETMKTLRSEGMRFTLIDFGAGMASLAWLRRYPLSRIRLDRSCLDHMSGTTEGAAILHANIHLAREIGLKVAAEGITNDEQLRVLTALGCHEAQGRSIARHMTQGEIVKMLGEPRLAASRDCA